MEGGDCGRGVALLARAPERTHCLELLLGEQGGELGERVHTSVAGQTGSDGDRQNGVQRVALAPVTAALGHLAQTLEQAAQPRRRHWLGVLLSVPVCRHLGPAQRLGGGVGQFEHEDLLGLAVVAPARRASGLAGKAAGQPQRAPVRRAVAGPDKARDIHERLRQKDEDIHAPPGCPATGRTGSAPCTREAKLCTRPGVRMTKTRVVGDQMQAPELLLRRPADPAIACGQLERAGLPADRASQVSPCIATWRRPLPMTP